MDIVNPYIRKLTTSETLEHATRALETHREWMRRRTQNTVTPGPAASSENGASDKGKSKTASWAVKNPHSDDGNSLSSWDDEFNTCLFFLSPTPF